MDSQNVKDVSARVKAALEGIYGPYDPQFRNMRAVEEEFEKNNFFVNAIMNNPGSELYATLHRNRERIKNEAERLKKANEEKERFEWQKKQYKEWVDRREAHKLRSLMPFMERPPRVMSSVIKFFENKEKDEEREALRKQLEATMTTDDPAPLFSPVADNGTKYPPPRHAHLNPLLTSSSDSSTIVPKDKKEMLPSARPPVLPQPLKPKPLSSTNLPKDKKETMPLVRPAVPLQPPKPKPLSSTNLPKDKKETMPSARPAVPPQPPKPKPLSSTIVPKDEKEPMPLVRPAVHPQPPKPKPALLPPTVAVAELVSSKIDPSLQLKPLMPTSGPLPTILPKGKKETMPSARQLVPSLPLKPGSRPPTVAAPKLPKITPFFFRHQPLSNNMGDIFDPVGGSTLATSLASGGYFNSLRGNLPPKSPLRLGSHSTDPALKLVDIKKDEEQHQPEDDDLEEGEIVDDDDEEQRHGEEDDRKAGRTVERHRNRHREDDDRSDRHRHHHREEEKTRERDRKTYRARKEDEPRDRHRQKQRHREEDGANERYRQKSRHHEDVPKEGSTGERRRDKHRHRDEDNAIDRHKEHRHREEKDPEEGGTSERRRNEHRRRVEGDLEAGSSSGRHRKDHRHREEDGRDAKK
uniref:Uncharacterized protein n=1 Tax=Panagrellus redivivus TaxID=6233 RepID=A0A7E4V5S5_PANRE